MKRWIAAALLVAVLGIGGWFGYRAWTGSARTTVAARQDLAMADESGDNSVETIDTGSATLANGGTPMAQRVAVIGLLNKRNGVAREVSLKPGQATRVGDVIIRLRACEQTAPWEQDHYTGAFVQLDVQQFDRTWKRAFSGWLYKERPALNVVQHPIYDVWTKSCAMTFPVGGPDSVPAEGETRSSAKKSPAEAAPSGEAPGPTTPSTAADSNAT